MMLNVLLCSLVGVIHEGTVNDNLDETQYIEELNDSYSLLCFFIIYVADGQGYDIFGAMREKLAYNRQRADHKRENRTGQIGQKSF